MNMRLIMENFRSFKEGAEAYEKYVDMVGQDKVDSDNKAGEDAEASARDDAEFEKELAKAHEIIFNHLKGLVDFKGKVSDYIKTKMQDDDLSSESKVENFLEAVKDVGGIEDAVAHIKEKNLKGADEHLPKLAELHKQLSNPNDGAGLEKGDSFEYTSKTGKESAIQVVDPENEHGATVAQKIDPESCEPKKNTQFASDPDKFVDAVGEPIDKCDAEAGGDSKIAELIAQKLKSTGLDKYIMKITKRKDLFELEKVILNLALDSSSPIAAQDLLKVVIDLKKDIEGKMQADKKG